MEVFSPHIRTLHLDIIKVLFTHQLMHYWLVLQNNIKMYVKTAAEEQPGIPQELLQCEF
jgi:hypothetical protein